MSKINIENGQHTFNVWVTADGKEKVQTETGAKEKVQNEAGAKRMDREGWEKGNRYATPPGGR